MKLSRPTCPPECGDWYYTKAILIFSFMALFLCFEMALQVSPGVMTRQLTKALSLTPFSLGLMSGFYYVTYTAMQIPSGLMFDRTNFRVLVTLAILICSLGAALFGLSNSIITASLSRLLMGFGSAFAFLSVLTVADRYFPARYFALLTGIAQLLAAIGGMAGELPIAWLIDKLDWRNTLLLLAGIGTVLGLIIWWIVTKPKKPAVNAETCENVSRTLHAIVRKPQTWWVAVYAFLNWAPVTAFAALWGVPYLQAAYGLPTTQAASLCALMWLGIGVASPFIGGLSDLMGRRNVLLIVTALIGMISISLVLYTTRLPIWLLGSLLFLTGLGSSGQILSFAVVKDESAKNRVSTSIGFNNMAVVASGMLMQPLIGHLLSHHAAGSDTYLLADFRYALILLPICYGICALLPFCLIRETYCGNKL